MLSAGIDARRPSASGANDTLPPARLLAQHFVGMVVMEVQLRALTGLIALPLAAFFLTDAIGNIFASAQTAADYARWGYPEGFHYASGSLEPAAALLLVFRSRRLWGGLLGAAVMAAASATLLWHGEYTHAIAPLGVLALSVTVAFTAPRGQVRKPH